MSQLCLHASLHFWDYLRVWEGLKRDVCHLLNTPVPSSSLGCSQRLCCAIVNVQLTYLSSLAAVTAGLNRNCRALCGCIAALTRSNLVTEVISNVLHLRVKPKTTTEGFIQQPLERSVLSFSPYSYRRWLVEGIWSLRVFRCNLKHCSTEPVISKEMNQNNCFHMEMYSNALLIYFLT